MEDQIAKLTTLEDITKHLEEAFERGKLGDYDAAKAMCQACDLALEVYRLKTNQKGG